MDNKIFENEKYSVVFAERRDIGNEWNDVKWNITHKQIQYHRLYLLTEGKAKLYLQDGELDLVPRNVYFIPAFSVRESKIDGAMNKYYIHFQASSPFFNLYRYLSNKYCYPISEISEHLFKTVVENYSSNSMKSIFKVQGAMSLLLSDFLAEASASSADLLKFEGVLKYIDEHYKENIPLSKLASIMNISSMYFSNYFKSTFNISPKQYILNKRLMESQRLLLENKLSIKEIAYEVGFENENYFSEFFSSKVGISALKFRKRELPTTRESIL
jgi:AraC-like DNA-binding protein